ncbi:MAG: response regulator transcription factor [Mobilicoccus sp.]|nr:response regulator transcription factor [Mobilicoccus sp.]
MTVNQATVVSVLIAEDEVVFRLLLARFVEGHEALELAGAVDNGREAVAQYTSLRPDVVLMDITMPLLDGPTATAQICALDPAAKVLALTASADIESVARMVQAGARGYLVKSSAAEVLAEQIVDVAAGHSVVSPELVAGITRAVSRMTAMVSGVTEARGRLLPPSSAELTILRHLAGGASNQQIASAAHVSLGTVKNRLAALSQRWECSSRTEVLAYAVRHGYVELAPANACVVERRD